MSSARQESCVYCCDVLQLMDPQNLVVPKEEVRQSSQEIFLLVVL
jgi:hypothetical protein